MAKQLFSNNASSLLAASISDSDLTIQVTGGFGALFPTPGADEYFLVALENDVGDLEVVKVTSRSTDLFTVPTGGRGQEGTSAQSWTNGQTRVELRLTRGTMEVFLQRGGDAMDGDLDMDGNELKDVIVTGTDSMIDSISEIVDTPLRGATGDASNEIAVPSDGSRATAGGQPILTDANVEEIVNAAFVVGQVIMWHGTIGAIPDGWALCNGDNGTPDLRDKFVIGAGGAVNVNGTGGAATAAAGTTGSAGEHTHATTTGEHTLTTAELPATPLSVRGSYGQGGYDGGPNEFFRARPANPFTTSHNLIEPIGEGQPHSHPGGTTDDPGGHQHSTPEVATIPPYYGLYFIKFLGIF